MYLVIFNESIFECLYYDDLLVIFENLFRAVIVFLYRPPIIK